MVTKPPKTGNASLDGYLNEVYQELVELETKARPEEGWALSDLSAPVSEVIGDKRDLIDIVTKWDGSAAQIEEWESVIASQSATITQITNYLSDIDDKSKIFAQVFEWWDQNYNLIIAAQDSYEEIAATYANIMTSEANTKTSETNAKTSEDAAKASELASKTSEDAAKASQNAAKTSETNAASSKTAAASSETKAKTSETNAKTSETNANNSASAAKTSETNAKASENAANDSFTAASSSASTAQEAARTAGTQADRSKSEADRASAAAGQAEETLASGVPDATASTRGKVKLAGDLGGTADSPTVPGLAGKANASHSHAIGDVTNLQSTLDSKAPTSHTHPVAQVTGLQSALDGKASASNRPPVEVVSALPANPVAGTLYLVQEA